MISMERFRERLARLRTITAPGEGVTRLAFTDSDWEGRAYFISLMKEAGLSVREDAFGNVIGRREGTRPDLAPVLCGSHGDSVPEGGNFDGVCGVLCAIEIAQSMAEDGWRNERPYEAALFMCEESSRFGAATLGSRAMCGMLSPADLLTYHDRDGRALYDVLKARGLDPDHVEDAKYRVRPAAYFEMHIEQGRVLEHEGKKAGVVTGIAAPTRLRFRIHGKQDHSGAAPMRLRHDGLAAAAELILAVERIARSHADPPVVSTAGTLRLKPNAINVVPGEVTLGVDIRSISAAAKADAVRAVLAEAGVIAKRRGVPFEVETVCDETPAPLRREMVDFLCACCAEEGLPYMTLPSGAGHDAMHWADVCPTGMLFLPCRDGVSHNPREWAELEDIAGAARVMERAVRRALRAGFSLEGDRDESHS